MAFTNVALSLSLSQDSECPRKQFSGRRLHSYPAWGRAVFPRSGMCVSWPAAGSLAVLGPRRRGAGPSGSPAASSPEESSATTGRDRQGDFILRRNLPSRRLKGWLSHKQHESAPCAQFELIVVSCAGLIKNTPANSRLPFAKNKGKGGESKLFLWMCVNPSLKRTDCSLVQPDACWVGRCDVCQHKTVELLYWQLRALLHWYS